jgi:hypothetical protein
LEMRSSRVCLTVSFPATSLYFVDSISTSICQWLRMEYLVWLR